MDSMTSIERAKKTFAFEQTDRPPIDLMENNVWPALREYFTDKHGLAQDEEILKFLHSDFR